MDIVITLLFILVLNGYLFYRLRQGINASSNIYLWSLFVLHALLTATYAIYAASSTSDSYAYYEDSVSAGSWEELWGRSTAFIRFIAWPFTNMMGLSYYASMIVFSYIGFTAILLFYITAKENVQLKPVLGKLTWVELVFLLPNLHFWSASLGKGSTILFGLALFTYGLSRFNRRIVAILVGSVIVFLIRPHIFLTLVAGVMLGVIITSHGIKAYMRWLILALSLVIFFFISDSVMQFAGTDTLNVIDAPMLTKKASELSKAGSGVNLSDYNIFMKLFTFWFRPLFIDAPGLIGIIASFENLFYLVFFFIIIREGILYWSEWNGWFRILLFIFILGSVLLSQVTANLGIAMRQKAQLMPFMFIVFCKAVSYLDERREVRRQKAALAT